MRSVTEPPPRRRTQDERRAETRGKLLRAAGRVFAARGFRTATLDEVASVAGVSKGSVYYNFESKEDLFLHLLEERLQTRLAEVERALEAGSAASGSAGSRFLQDLQRDPRWPPLFLEFAAHAAREPAVGERFSHWLSSTREALARLIEARAQELGEYPRLPPERLALAINALVNGMLIEGLFDPAGAPASAVDEFIGLLMGGGARA